jgi:ABC-type uncharacterized transport system substrate-binding protein
LFSPAGVRLDVTYVFEMPPEAGLQRAQSLCRKTASSIAFIRFGADNSNLRKYAGELAASAPDVILAVGSAAAPPLLQATQTVPIVFALVADPVDAVDSLARPGGNATGFTLFEYALLGGHIRSRR